MIIGPARLARYGVGGRPWTQQARRFTIAAHRPRGATTLDDPSRGAQRGPAKAGYPQVRIIGPGFYWKLPWQRLHRASIATETVSIAFDPEDSSANSSGQVLEAVTKDQLNTGLTGQLRFTVSENLYAICSASRTRRSRHGVFRLGARDRIANFEAPVTDSSGFVCPFDDADGSDGEMEEGQGIPSTICARTSAISTSGWTRSARRRPLAMGWRSTPR